MRSTVDRTFLFLTVVLVLFGFLIFTSASLGLLAREGARFSSVAFSQVVFGIIGGGLALFFASTVHYRVWRQYAFYIAIVAFVATFAVFIPGLGMEHGGAQRWLNLGPISFQPSEFLKIAFIIYIATWLSGMKKYISGFKKGTLPFLLLLAGVGVPLLLQPDTDSYLIIVAASMAMFIVAGGRIRDVILMGVIATLLLASLAMMRPYVKERIITFIDPSRDPQGAGYQITQSLIAVGSGGLGGRGFGQSIQKFEYLPEPIGDSIFAVYAEEFGFIGSIVIILIFMSFSLRGYRIAARSPDLFGMLLVVGLITLIVIQMLLNIAAMVGIAPLSGLPLPFISHGGTALLMMLASIGIILNVSKYQKKRI